jgi:hydrogenase maturation protease
MNSVVVVGIGQSLRGDDALGLEAVRRWRRSYPRTAGDSRVRVEVSELPGLSLLDMIADSQAAVLVDAVCSAAPAGTLHLLTTDDPAAFAEGSASAHGWGLAETLALGRTVLADALPRRITLIGVEMEQVQLGQGLSASVEQAMPHVAEAIDRQVRGYLS